MWLTCNTVLDLGYSSGTDLLVLRPTAGEGASNDYAYYTNIEELLRDGNGQLAPYMQ